MAGGYGFKSHQIPKKFFFFSMGKIKQSYLQSSPSSLMAEGPALRQLM